MEFLKEPTVLTTIGAGLAAVGTLISTWGAITASNKRAQFEYELRAKSDKIATLAEENQKLAQENNVLITGGDSYCVVTLAKETSEPDNVRILFVRHVGTHTLSDIRIRLLDLDEMERLQTQERLSNVAAASRSAKFYNIVVLPKDSDFIIDRIELPSGADQLRLIFDITSRAGGLKEKFTMRKVNGSWRLASKIFRFPGDESQPLLEEAEPDFPRDSSGKILY